MGVISLWQLLEPVRQTRSLPELSGQKIAIDLSAWIMGSKRVAVSSRFRNVYLRTIFLRTLDLLKCGIQPVFVCDGCIPKIKFDKVRIRCKGRSFGKSGPILRDRSQSDTTQICFHLFKCLGLPCLKSEGEGEALCAFLNNEQIVDGCLTSDSDILLYGAKKVYRNYKKKNKVGYLECYDAKDIHTQLKLDQRALVGLALLLGCDYNQLGVPGVGVKTAVRMIREMQRKNIDSLQRMLSWRTNQELQDLQEKMDIFNKEKHCSECLHIVVSHNRNGCDLCGDNINVSEDLEDCECSCHSYLQTFISHEEEFKVRQKAMLVPNFPSEEVIEEFLIPTESVDLEVDVSWQEPNFADLQSFVFQHLHWNGHVLFKMLIPLLIQWKLNSSSFSCLKGLEPLRITKKHRKNYQLVYEVEWSKMQEDIWTIDATYWCSVNRDLFHKRFPEMVKAFEESLLPAMSVDESKKKLISDLSHRMTRSALKKEGLTLSDIQDGNQVMTNNKNELRTGQYGMSIRKSKRLLEKNTGKNSSHLPGEVTQSTTEISDSFDLKTSVESFNLINSIPKTFAGIKKQKNAKTKAKFFGSASVENRRNVSVEMLPSKYSNLIGVCTVTLERIPIVSNIKEVIQNVSVNNEDQASSAKSSSGDTLEPMDCVEQDNGSASMMGGIENTLNCQNEKMKPSNNSEKCFDGVSAENKNSTGMNFIVEGTNRKDVMMEGSDGMGSITEGLEEGLEVLKREHVMMKGSNNVDSIVDSLNSDNMMVGSFGAVSIVEGSNTGDIMQNDSNDMNSIVEDTKRKNMMKGSNGMDFMVEVSNRKDEIKSNSNGKDSIVEGINTKDLIMEGSNGMDSIVEGMNSKDLMMEGSNGMDSIVEGINTKDLMMEGSNGMDSNVEGINTKDLMMEGINSKDLMMEGSNGMDSIVEGINTNDLMMEGSHGMDSIVEGINTKDLMMKGSHGMDSIVEGINSKDLLMESSHGMDSIVEGINSKDLMMAGSNGMNSFVEGINSKDLMMEGSYGIDSIADSINSKNQMMVCSTGMDSIVQCVNSKNMKIDSSNSHVGITEVSNSLDSIVDDSNNKALMMQASNNMTNMVMSSSNMHSNNI